MAKAGKKTASGAKKATPKAAGKPAGNTNAAPTNASAPPVRRRRKPADKRLKQAIDVITTTPGPVGPKLKALGYSDRVARNPKDWLMMHQERLRERLHALGYTEERLATELGTSLATENEQVRLRALDMILRVMGSYAPQQVEHNDRPQVDLQLLDEVELQLREELGVTGDEPLPDLPAAMQGGGA